MNNIERVDEFEESLMLALDNAQSKVWTSLPGIVTAVNLDAQTVSVQPAIKGVVFGPDGYGEPVNLPVLVDVPIIWPRAGGFALTFPIKPGNEVLVSFSARCIDSWWQSGGVGNQAEMRMHDLSDAFAILAPTSQPNKLTSVSDENVQLRDEAGTTYIEITPDGKVRVIGENEISFDAPTINMNCNSLSMYSAFVSTISSGGVTYISGGGGTNIDGRPFGYHQHYGVQSGGDISGPPV